MCLSIPARILELRGHKALVENYKGQSLEVNTAAIKELKKNDWLLIFSDLAVGKLSKNEANKIIKLLRN